MTLSITALRALLAAGTPGPWRATKGKGAASVVASDCAVYINVNRDGLYIDDTVHRWQADAALIAAAHEALPELLDEMERLRVVVEAIASNVTDYFDAVAELDTLTVGELAWRHMTKHLGDCRASLDIRLAAIRAEAKGAK